MKIEIWNDIFGMININGGSKHQGTITDRIRLFSCIIPTEATVEGFSIHVL